MLTFIT
jgi:mitochondrial distribution and morphology protein 31